MKKLRVWMIAAVLTVCGTVANAQLSKGHFFKTFRGKAVPVATAERHFAEWFSLPDGTEWKLVSNSTDRLGMSRLEYRQYVDGIEVEHSQILLHVKNHLVQSANGTVMESYYAPQPSAKVRRSGVPFAGQAAADALGRPVLLVSAPDGYHYATKTLLSDGRRWVYTDIDSGEQVKTVAARHYLDKPEGKTATVTGKSLYSGDVPLTVTQTSDGKNYLYDQERNIHTLVGAYIPSMEQMAEDGIIYDYLPQLDLPDDFTEATEEQLQKWSDALGDMAKEGKLDKVGNMIYDHASYVSNDGGVFSAYKLNTLTINKLFTFDDNIELQEMTPEQIGDTDFKLVLRYGADLEKNSIGIIEDYPFEIEQLPFTLDLSDYQEVIPREGITIQIMTKKKVTFDFPDLPDFPFEYNTLDDDPEEEEGEGEEEESDYKVLTSITLTPNTSDGGSHSFKEILAEGVVTYEASGDPAADIHWGMACTLDFYKEKLGRNSFDDKGAPVYNLVYVTNDGDESMFSMGLGNAAALPEISPSPMVYSLGGYEELEGITSRPVVELTVMSHEFTHLVTDQTAKLVYEGESGALNESFSDIIGISVNKYVKGNDSGWLLGGNNLLVNASCMRDMANPKNSSDGDDPSPDTYKGQHWVDTEDTSESNDYGGVHNNSGVQNKWYYLLTDGDSGTNDHGTSYNVTGIGIEKSQQIAYRTLTVYATEESQYADIREASLEAAKDLYGDNSAEVKSVGDAWDAVGVNGQGDVPDGIAETAVAPATTTTTVYDLQGRPVVPAAAGIYIQNGRKVAIK